MDGTVEQMARYLVTGGCGFIGSHLCEALVRRGHAVRVLDDLSTGRLENLVDGVELLYGSITDNRIVKQAVAHTDGCFHLAAIASVERGTQDWLGTHSVNQTGTIVLLDALRHLPNKPPMVFASSAAVYGNCRALPITEAIEPRPLSAYGADKYGCELHARIAFHVHRVPSVGLRFFNVYGPRQDPHSPYSGVISVFCDRVARGEAIEIYGDGRQTRDFVYVADVVAAMLAAMELRPGGATVCNVCTGLATSVRELADQIAELCGTHLKIRHRPARTGDIRNSVGSFDQARTLLDLGRTIDLQTGLHQLLMFNAVVPGLVHHGSPRLPRSGLQLFARAPDR